MKRASKERRTFKKVPKHIVEAYGTARAFKQSKRNLLSRMRFLLMEFRAGCAYLPSGHAAVDRIAKELAFLADDISEKNWGR